MKKPQSGIRGELPMANTNTSYQLVCGMEIHAELKTASKMFCGCKNDPFHAPQPNIYTCPVCLGMPGALPVANKKAIEWAIKLGLALNCKINLFSKFDRKHYFYPDLPKGYQISQYDIPFCYDGVVETEEGLVRIHRIHLEEDTGKLLHKTIGDEKVSLIDFNRSSVPLIEIVSEADIKTPTQAKAFGKKIRQILRFLDIADCDMEQGGMRLEANISLRPPELPDNLLPNYKVEVKNINSFRFLEQAISWEMQRQALELMAGRTPKQETRGWDSTHNTTFPQRSKEDAEDYRYFPDPDLPPIRFTEAQVAALRQSIPELPAQLLARWQSDFGVEEKYSRLLIDEPSEAAFYNQLFEMAQTEKLDANKVANLIANKKLLVTMNDVTKTWESFKKMTAMDNIDASEVAQLIHQVIAENPSEVIAYQAGKTQLLNFFLGQVMRLAGKKIDATLIRSQLETLLNQKPE